MIVLTLHKKQGDVRVSIERHGTEPINDEEVDTIRRILFSESHERYSEQVSGILVSTEKMCRCCGHTMSHECGYKSCDVELFDVAGLYHPTILFCCAGTCDPAICIFEAL